MHSCNVNYLIFTFLSSPGVHYIPIVLFCLQQECEDLNQKVETSLLPKLTVVSYLIHKEQIFYLSKDDYRKNSLIGTIFVLHILVSVFVSVVYSQPRNVSFHSLENGSFFPLNILQITIITTLF